MATVIFLFQTYAAVGVGFVCLFIGIPLWWKTTEVYRVSLPYADITDLTQSKDGSNEEKNYLKTVSKVEELDNIISNKDDMNTYQIVLIEKNSLSLTKPFIGSYRSVFYPVKQKDLVGEDLSRIISDVLIKEVSLSKTFNSIKGARNNSLKTADKESMRSLKYNPGYDITFTLVSPQPDIIDAQWDIEGGVKVYLEPLIKQLEQYADFNVKSQVLFFTGLLRRPKKVPDLEEFHYTEKDLPHVINPLEAKLGSHSSNNPTLNFLLYVPSRDQSPLHIVDPSVHINMKVVMEIFLTQLRLLLNLHAQGSKEYIMADVGSKILTQWELDNWLRSRCMENLATSIASLQSLSQLLGQISNIVINDDIGKEVHEAVESIQQSQRHLVSGQLSKAVLSSKRAIISSEKAFFDPSLLELLYFPEDQNLPVLASLWKAYKWYKSQKKSKTD
ncbi:hypothetical protein KUTeg_011340 [Tegillarca granosa]|uniref:GPI transamidase component PIG-S n=1 Tax=Tegillarca granosa TaxID=220873 RepID=A0ABQ9F133_TEGGR|nr:hypothetical protein KUTeg_011340 [Tegillarca granosa]